MVIGFNETTAEEDYVISNPPARVYTHVQAVFVDSGKRELPTEFRDVSITNKFYRGYNI